MTAKKPTIWLLDDSGLSRESWWIQLGIPSTLNFPDYFALTRKNRTEREEEQRKIIAILSKFYTIINFPGA